MAKKQPPKETQKRRVHRLPLAKKRATIVAPISEVDRKFLAGDSDGIPGFSPRIGGYGVRHIVLTALRNAALTEPYVRSFLNIMKQGVIGQNPIVPTFSAVSNTRTRKELQMMWTKWQRNCHRGRMQNLWKVQRAILEMLLVDGRVIVVFRYNEKYPNGVKIQALPRESIADEMNNESEGISRGIRYDKETGDPVSYFLYKSTEKAVNYTSRPWYPITVGGETREVPVSMICDLHTGNRADDWDGDSPNLITAYNGLRDVFEIDTATLRAMKAASCQGGFLERELGSNPGGGKNAPALTAEDEDNEVPSEIRAGAIDMLPPGYKFASYNPAWPNTDGELWRRVTLQAIAASLGVDWNTLSSDASTTNYSSLRHFSLQSREVFRSLQRDIVDSMMRKVLELWLTKIRMDGFDMSMTSQHEAEMTNFDTRSYPWVDPLKDSKAMTEKIQNLGMSFIDFSREGGREMSDIIAENLEVAEMLGIKEGTPYERIQKVMELTGGKAAAPAAPATPEEEETPPDDKGGKNGKS